jgi:hypothetical protein
MSLVFNSEEESSSFGGTMVSSRVDCSEISNEAIVLTANMTKKNFYAVSRGETTGIFTRWSKGELSIHKYSNAVFKAFGKSDDMNMNNKYRWILNVEKQIDHEMQCLLEKQLTSYLRFCH